MLYNVKSKEASEITGLSVHTLSTRRSIGDKRLSWVKRDNRIFYAREELEAYAKSGALYA